MICVYLSLLLTAITLVVTYLYCTYTYWQRRGVPYERPIPIFGNLKDIGRNVHFRDVNQRLYNKFKGTAPFAGLYMFFSKAAFILDLDLVKNILIKDFANFHDRGIFNNVRDDPLTGHLLTLEGEEWKAMRNKITPVFTSGKMKFMFPTVVTVGENLAKTCKKLLKEDKSCNVEMKELSARYTTDVIGTCAFGIECNSLEDPHAEFRQKGRSIIEQPRHSQAVQAFMITNPKLALKLRMKLLSDEVSTFFLSAVRRTVDFRIKNGVRRNDFMDMLIEMKAKDEAAAKSAGGIDLSHGLTLEQIAAQAFVFFIAGFDTSSTTMAFCLYELAINPDIQERLREEILMDIKKHDGKLTYEALSEMIYLEQVLSETLRKYSVLPHIIRQAVSDYPVPNSDLVIEGGMNIIIPIHAIHYDPEFYPNPEKFDPERFTPEAIKQRPSVTYLPFGDGPRNCIGLRFGKMQAKIGLISLLRKFRFSPSAKTEVPIELSTESFLIASRNGIHLHVTEL